MSDSDKRSEWLAAIAAAADSAALKQLEQDLLGKAGQVTAMVKGVKDLPPEERPAAGKAANILKQELIKAIEARGEALAELALQAELEAGDFDPSAPGPRQDRGTVHPITVVQDELVELFHGMGFQQLDGPEVETEWFNFEALNIPGDHPARDSQDTFFLGAGQAGGGEVKTTADGTFHRDGSTHGLVLRTHTSPVQIRAMREASKDGNFQPPLKCIVPGRCFRAEDVDASHEHTFYQMEGLVIDRDVGVSHLIHTMKTCLRHVLRREVEVRLRPGYFPFVEPGFELDVNCPFCGGDGCSVCKHSGWIEILPCGMVHPKVLEAGGIDPEEFTGFAFGMGLQRVVMLRYGIDDIRHFMGGDLRFLGQFPEVQP